jgi:hypothetical protein
LISFAFQNLPPSFRSTPDHKYIMTNSARIMQPPPMSHSSHQRQHPTLNIDSNTAPIHLILPCYKRWVILIPTNDIDLTTADLRND